jgi:hypothetical protein
MLPFWQAAAMRLPSLLYVHVVGMTFLPCTVRGLNTLFCFFGFSTSHILTVLKKKGILFVKKKKKERKEF